MEVGLGVTVFLSKTEIDDVDLVPALADTHQEVVGLDVTVNEVSRMDVLDPRDLEYRAKPMERSKIGKK